MDNHSTYIISTVVIIVIFLLILLATMSLSKESFQTLAPAKFTIPKQGNFVDTNVPQGLKFKNATSFYQDLDDGLKGTPLVNVSEVLSNRFPIAIETPMNWYSTQPLATPITVGTQKGKSGKCGCESLDLI